MRKRILVCDDEESIRLLLQEVLAENYDIVQAGDGRDALKMVTNGTFDLLIMDIKMPRMHGIEAIEKIRERNSVIPIIVCTAYKMMQDDIALYASNVAGFITKPIDIAELKSKVSELVGM
jgi:CheY-like chemotaxis protein